jgi:hypothetical protein
MENEQPKREIPKKKRFLGVTKVTGSLNSLDSIPQNRGENAIADEQGKAGRKSEALETPEEDSSASVEIQYKSQTVRRVPRFS